MGENSFWKTYDLLQGRDSHSGHDDIEKWLANLSLRQHFLMDQEENQKTPSTQTPTTTTIGFVGSDSFSSLKRRSISNKNDSIKNKKGTNKNGKLQKKIDNQQDDLLNIGPTVDCSFNLPRVSDKLETLMGTNVVRLTDRRYMQELRKRIYEDYNVILQKRIAMREHQETERTKKLILKGSYSASNCPKKFIILHSILLAKEMERERNLIMEGRIDKYPSEFANHPVFIINQRTNIDIARRREKLKTIKEKNADRLIKQGKKWEKERQIHDELDRLQEIEMEKEREAKLMMIQNYVAQIQEHGIDILRKKDTDFVNFEKILQAFFNEEINLFNYYMKKNIGNKKILQKKQQQKKKDENFNNNCRDEPFPSQLMENNLMKMKNKIDQLKSIVRDPSMIRSADDSEEEMMPDKMKDFNNDDTDADSYFDQEINDEEHVELLNKDIQTHIEQGHILTPNEFKQFHFEDPAITKLKETDNVHELYTLADEIINGSS